jgi:hypothetical protein
MDARQALGVVARDEPWRTNRDSARGRAALERHAGPLTS